MNEIPPPPPGYGYVQQPQYVIAQRPNSGMAVASMVLGIVGLILGFLWVIPPILAVIFGGVGIRQTNTGLKSGKGMAIAGLTTGLIGLAFWGIVILAAIGAAS